MNEHSYTIAIVALAGFACVSSVVWMFTRDTASVYYYDDKPGEEDDPADYWKKGK